VKCCSRHCIFTSYSASSDVTTDLTREYPQKGLTLSTNAWNALQNNIIKFQFHKALYSITEWAARSMKNYLTWYTFTFRKENTNYTYTFHKDNTNYTFTFHEDNTNYTFTSHNDNTNYTYTFHIHNKNYTFTFTFHKDNTNYTKYKLPIQLSAIAKTTKMSKCMTSQLSVPVPEQENLPAQTDGLQSAFHPTILSTLSPMCPLTSSSSGFWILLLDTGKLPTWRIGLSPSLCLLRKTTESTQVYVHTQRSQRLADPSSRGNLPIVVCHCVWSTNLKNETAMARTGLLRREKNVHTSTVIQTYYLHVRET
jgi:hypothetical protein